MTMSADQFRWLRGLGIYLGVMVIGNLIWEIAHLPLYTIWLENTRWEQVYAVVHCTIGDVLIALSSFLIASLLVGNWRWPALRYWPVVIVAVPVGVSYTVFSEWKNVYVQKTWAYSDLMPIVSIGSLDIGLSPILQWIMLPVIAFTLIRRWSLSKR